MFIIYPVIILVTVFSVSQAVHEKNELLAHPKTWKGEMLMPPDATPTPSPAPKEDE